jgi:hypothetical protein
MSADEFWGYTTPQDLLKSRGLDGCPSCKGAAILNYARMRAKIASHFDGKQMLFLGGGVLIGALLMHLYMKR